MKRDPITIDDRELVSIIEQEVSQSIGHWDGSLSGERATEMDYYLGKPFGNEVEGESQVVSTDVADTVEGLLPIILKIFTASDDVVQFDPNGPEDEEGAKQQTEVANYVFYRQNNGFLVLYEWFKDALIQKNGVVKYWWEDKQERTKESYEDLTDAEYRGLMQKDEYLEIEELEHTQSDDPEAVAKIQQVKEQISQMMQGPAGQMPQAQEQASQMLQQIEQTPIPQLHDVTVRILKDVSKLCIQAIPPEEFGISAKHNCVSIQETGFCYQRSKQTISALRQAGCPEEVIEQLSVSNERDTNQESISRDRFLDNQWADQGSRDDSSREVWVTEGFIRLDYDGDGVAELRHFIMPDRVIWVNEETDHINFSAITPVIMPHRWTGRSVTELVADIQFQKSVIWRQMLNNLYLTNNPQKAVLATSGGIVHANIDDLLTSRPGGLLREYLPNAIRNIETPFVAGASFPMIEYMDSVKENRTGVTRYNQGTDADSLNKTARGIGMIQAAGQERTNLIARIFAETGVKDLMRGIVYMLSKYGSKAMTVKLRNKWVQVDPREWKTQYNMTVNVGLGTGNKDIQVAHLGRVAELQMAMMKEGRPYMVSDENIYNVSKKMAEAMGFKNPEMFFVDPKTVPDEAKKPPPSPDMIKIQAEAQESQAKLQFEQQKEPFRAETEKAIAQITSQTSVAVAQINAQTQKEIAAMKIQADAQLKVFEKQANIEGEQRQLEDGRKELTTAAQTESMALDGKAKDMTYALETKAMEIKHAEQMLAIKKQMDTMMDQHRAEMEKTNEGKTEDREKKMALTMQTSMDQVAKLMKDLVGVQKETLDFLKSPKRQVISDPQFDSSGKITAATVTPTIQ